MNTDVIPITIIVILSFFLNIFVIFTLFMSWKTLNTHFMLLLSLALVELIQALCGYTYMMIFYMSDSKVSNQTVCRGQALVVTSMSLSVIAHMTSLSIEQKIAITKPFGYKIMFPKRKTYSLFFILPCWLYGLIWSMLPFFGWSAYTSEPYWCSIELKKKSLSVISCNSCLIIFCFFLPVSIIIYCHLKILMEFKRIKSKAVCSNGADSFMARKSQVDMRKRTVLIIVIVIVYLVSWTPYAVAVILKTFDVSLPDKYLSNSALMGKCSTIYNPIVYTFAYKDFRRKVQHMLMKLQKCTQTFEDTDV